MKRSIYNRSINNLSVLMLLIVGFGACQQEMPAPAQSQAGEEEMAEPAMADAAGMEPVEIWQLTEGLNRPESVVFDAASNALYVSNINGNANEKNGTGYLSKVSLDGQMIEQEWVTGLNAPKGVDARDGKLYVSDIDELIEVEITTGEVLAKHAAEGALFLNDVTIASNGDVYVSDMNTNRVYRLSGGALEVWLEGAEIMSPNGLFAEEDRLLILANGAGAENAGSARYVMAIDYESKEVTPVKDEVGIGGLDAVKPDGAGGYYLSDWGAGKVFHFTEADGAVDLVTLTQGTADLDYVVDSGMMYLPVMMSDRLVAYSVRAEM
jgi:sugar lactone lactonase YvrE